MKPKTNLEQNLFICIKCLIYFKYVCLYPIHASIIILQVSSIWKMYKCILLFKAYRPRFVFSVAKTGKSLQIVFEEKQTKKSIEIYIQAQTLNFKNESNQTTRPVSPLSWKVKKKVNNIFNPAFTCIPE